MDNRNLFAYKCHTCKQTKEPNEFGYNNQTKMKRVTCDVCQRKRSERAAALRETRAQAQPEIVHHDTGEVDHQMTESTEEPETRLIVYLPRGTSEEEPVCENACSNRLQCTAVRARFTCLHLQCVRTHMMLHRCIACSCSTLRYDREMDLSNIFLSSSGAAVPETEPEAENYFVDEPEEEMEPENEDFSQYFVTEEP